MQYQAGRSSATLGVMTTPSASSRRSDECRGLHYVLLLLTIPGLYAVQWTLDALSGSLQLSTPRLEVLVFAWVYLSLGIIASYFAWKNLRGVLPVVVLMWILSVVATLTSYFWHLNSGLTPFRLLYALAFFSVSFSLCVRCLLPANRRQRGSSMPPNQRLERP